MNTWAKSFRLPLNLQLFAGEGGDGGGQGGTGGGQAGSNQSGGNQDGGGQAGDQTDGQTPELSDDVRSYLDKLVQSNTDKVRNQYSQQMKDLEKRLRDTEREKETLAKEKMTDDEKAKFELDKERRALAQERAAVLSVKIENQAVTSLAELQLPATFKEFIMADSVENTAERAKQFQTAWSQAIQDEVEKRLAGGARKPARGNQQGSTDLGGMNALIRRGFGR